MPFRRADQTVAMNARRSLPSMAVIHYGATALRRVNRWVLTMLENRPAPIFCAWLRSRRASKSAALLTRLAPRGVQVVSGRGASRHIDARSPRGVERGAWFGKPPFRTKRSSSRREDFG